MTASDATLEPTFADSTERPVFLLSADTKLSDSLALDLRHHGWRVRTFVNIDVLRNAARNEPPLAVVADIAAAQINVDLLATLRREGVETTLLFLGSGDDFRQRLSAVRAGSAGYFPAPINRSALLYQLNALMSAASRQAAQILVVDDAASKALEDVAQALQAAGLRVLYLNAPQRTLQVLEQQRVDLLLLNDALSEMRGSELLQVVRQSWRFHALPAILLTHADKRRLDTEATAAGADAVLGLPVAATDLEAVVRAKLARAHQLFDMYGYSIRRDPDNGLFNRDYFLNALRQAIVEAGAGHGRAALLWLELEPLPAGRPDQATLAQVADLLLRRLPPLALAARMDDAAIAILLPTSGNAELEALLDMLRSALQPLPGLDCRLGTTLLTSRQRSAADALALARQAAGLQAAAATLAAPDRAATDTWATEVRAALQESRFRLVYQPIASLSGQPSSFYEVFIRMIGSDGRDILPQEFLVAVEMAGMAEALDRWVLARAVHVLESQRALRDQPTLFVKVFPDSVAAGPTLIHWLADRVHTAALDPARLVLQIRQQCASVHPARTQEFIAAARALGCRIALEHFTATGETGQLLLQSLQPDFVRLAPQLTQDIGSNREHQKLAEMIAGQCRAVGAKPIAALVQDALHLSVLWRCGVEYIQGYFMQEPADVFAPEENRSEA